VTDAEELKRMHAICRKQERLHARFWRKLPRPRQREIARLVRATVEAMADDPTSALLANFMKIGMARVIFLSLERP
jgi:hypothetical protein